jgi:hypothetical protein
MSRPSERLCDSVRQAVTTIRDVAPGSRVSLRSPGTRHPLNSVSPLKWNQCKRQTRSAPSPLVGEGWGGGSAFGNVGAPTSGPPPPTPPHKGVRSSAGLENSLRDFNKLFGISPRAFERRLHIGSTHKAIARPARLPRRVGIELGMAARRRRRAPRDRARSHPVSPMQIALG